MRLKGLVYRAHNPRWSFDPLSGAGASRHGGRFNPLGMAALYTSSRMETAWREAQQGLAFKAQPLTVCAYEVDCDDVVDLTDDATLADLGVTGAELSCAWDYLVATGQIPPTWNLARRLAVAGTAAAIVPSFAPGAANGDRNVVFWHWSGAAPHRVTVIDDEARLPKDDRSWR